MKGGGREEERGGGKRRDGRGMGGMGGWAFWNWDWDWDTLLCFELSGCEIKNRDLVDVYE